MTDIVERLLDMHNHTDTALRIEAATEIKRLRAKLKQIDDEQCGACRAKDEFGLKAYCAALEPSHDRHR